MLERQGGGRAGAKSALLMAERTTEPTTLPMVEQAGTDTSTQNSAVQGDAGQNKTASTGETGNYRLSDSDTADYLRVGKKQSVRNAKQAAVDAGEKIILSNDAEIENYIQDALKGGVSQTVKAYGKVGASMADDIYSSSNGSFDVEGWYLELVPDDIQHAYTEHTKAKRAGNIPLTKTDFFKYP